MMLTFLLAQEYQAIADVLRIWTGHKSLEFFEVNVRDMIIQNIQPKKIFVYPANIYSKKFSFI